MIKDKDVKIETKDIKNLTPSIKSGGFFIYNNLFDYLHIYGI